MTTRDLLSGPVTLSVATNNSRNLLYDLAYPKLREIFYQRIESHRPLLCDAVAHHLSIKSTQVTVSPREYWRHGSFNLVVPIAVDTLERPGIPQFVSLRFPLPYRVGETSNAGNSDEKLNCEAATYAWLQDECPTVPIPQLYGFGLSTNERFTNLNFLPWWARSFHRVRRCLLRTLGLQQPSQYVLHRSRSLADLDIGYLLIQTITSGEMLSESWDEKQEDVHRQHNLQRDIARIMLSLSSVPLPRIGAFRLDRKGYLHLDNRPLSVQWTIQENENIPIDMSRRQTFSRVDDFVHQHLAAFDNRLLHQPNAVVDAPDAWYQMTSLAAARSLFPRMFRKDLNSGPFAYTLTDLHRSNVFVDEDWNITCIIDLEFACSWPIEFVQPPYWLGGNFVDEMRPPEFAHKHAAFVEHVRGEEERVRRSQRQRDSEPLSSVMARSWTSGAFWAALAVADPVGFTGVFYRSILPFYFSCLREEDIDKADYQFFSLLWRPGVPGIIDKKLQDRERYLERLNTLFMDSSTPTPLIHGELEPSDSP